MEDIIRAFQVKKEVDNSNRLVENFWEKINKNEENSNSATSFTCGFQDLIKEIKKATEKVLIYTPQIASKELEEVFYNLDKNNVRIYIIVDNEFFRKLESNPYNEPIIRSSDNIKSTFVLVESSDRDNRGFWSSQPCIETSKFIKLSKNQTEALKHFFIEQFWSKNKGREIILGKAGKIPDSIEPAYDKKKINYEKWCLTKDLSYFEEIEENIITIGIKRKDIRDYMDKLFVSDADEIYLEESKLLKDFMINDIIPVISPESRIYLGKIPYSFIQLENYSWIVHEDIMLKFENKDLNFKSLIEVEWMFVFQKEIGEIKNHVCLYDHKWNNLAQNYQQIKEHANVPLNDVYLDNIDEFLGEYEKYESKRFEEIKGPEFPEELFLSKKITFSWNLHPPYLHKDAKEHELYKKWVTCFNSIKTKLEEEKKKLEEILRFKEKYSSESKKVNKYFKQEQKNLNTIAKSINDYIEKIKEYEELTKERISNLNEDIKEDLLKMVNSFNENVTIFLNFLKELNNVLQENKDDFKTELNEIEALRKEDQKIAKEIRNYFKQIQNYSSANRREVTIDTKIIPYYLPPKIGKLFKHRGKNYLLIERKSEIELAKTIAKKYENAIICVKGSD